MKHIFFFLMFFSGVVSSFKAQCSSCSTVVNASDTSNLVVASGQTVCFDSLSVFNGTLTLNGGSVCNKGLFKPARLVWQSGQFTNYGNVSIEGYDLVLGGNSVFTSMQGSIMNITNGDFKLQGGILDNWGVIIILGTMHNVSGTLNNYDLINCNMFNGNVPTINTGHINSN